MPKGVHIRINDEAVLDIQYIEAELYKGKHVIVQYSTGEVSKEQLTLLNTLCQKHDDNLGIRFYGYYSEIFDCAILSGLPNVKCLYIDCLIKVINLHVLADLHELSYLSFGVYELKETELLNIESLKRLRSLIIGPTKTKTLNLEYLEAYKSLKELTIVGHTKGIDAVGLLSQLEMLSLTSISRVSVAFINKMKKLKTLNFLLGGRDNILEIEENEIENLGIVWVRGLNDISNIIKFKKLKTLGIEDQVRLEEINFSEEMSNLTDLKIINCKKLKGLKGLENLKALNQIRISRTGLDFDSFISQKLPNCIKIFAFYSNRIKQDAVIKEKLLKLGYVDGLMPN